MVSEIKQGKRLIFVFFVMLRFFFEDCIDDKKRKNHNLFSARLASQKSWIVLENNRQKLMKLIIFVIIERVTKHIQEKI